MPMQESSAVVRRPPQSVDRAHSEAYHRLVAKDTSVESKDLDHLDTAHDDISSNGAVFAMKTETYYERRHARFMAAIRGSLPITEYLHEVVEAAGGQLSQRPPSTSAEH